MLAVAELLLHKKQYKGILRAINHKSMTYKQTYFEI